MTILVVYPNKLDRAIREFTPVASGQTLDDYLKANIKGYYVSNTPPFSVTVNGEYLAPSKWAEYVWQDHDFVEMVAEPKDPITAIMAVVAVVSAGMAIYAMSQIPDNFQKTTPEGSPIYDANAQGNQARLMGIIPELFGRHKTYPDLISEPHWYFFDDDEFLLMNTAISVGDISAGENDIVIGETPVSRYADDIDYRIFGPGESVTSHPAHENIYTSREVGATAGTAGIELEGPVVSITPDKLTLSKYEVTLYRTIDGLQSASWPVEWETGRIFELKGSNAPPVVTATGPRGCWGPYTNGEMHYRTQDPNAKKLKPKQYINLPNYVDASIKVGIVTSVFTQNIDGQDYNMVEVADANGDKIYVSTSLNDKSDLVPFGFNDAYYKVNSTTGTNATVRRLYPNKTDLMSYTGFLEQGTFDATNIRLTILDPLPGKPAGPFFACPVSEVTDRIYIDLKFPDGIGRMEDDGSISSRELRVMIEYRAEGDKTWKQQEFKRSAGTRDQLGNTVHINLGKKVRPEVRVYRISGDDEDSRVFDRIEFKRLKSRLFSASKYDDFSTLAIRIRGTNSLSRSAENKLGIIPTRMLQIPDGHGGWTTERYATRDIAPAVRYIIQDAGLSDFQIGHHELLRLHKIWQQRGDTFDAVFTDESTLFDVLKKVLAVGYAEPTLNYGQIVPVRDEPRTVFDYQYQPDNMLSKGLERDVNFIDEEEPDGVEVEYFSTETWKPETVMCLLPGEHGLRPEKVRAFGVTNKTKAWRFGMRVRRKKRYRRVMYSFQTEMDGFNSNYLDYLALADDVPGYAQSGRIEQHHVTQGNTGLRLDLPLEWGRGVHHIAIRKPNGRTSGPYVCMQGATPYDVVINGLLDFTPVLDGSIEPPLWLFGEADSWCYPALLMDVTPQGTEKCSIKACNYADEVYADDDNEPDDQGYPKVA
ncbi:TPA: host specificity factor TipJ family phage tail protein [Photobacterium damselae]